MPNAFIMRSESHDRSFEPDAGTSIVLILLLLIGIECDGIEELQQSSEWIAEFTWPQYEEPLCNRIGWFGFGFRTSELLKIVPIDSD